MKWLNNFMRGYKSVFLRMFNLFESKENTIARKLSILLYVYRKIDISNVVESYFSKAKIGNRTLADKVKKAFLSNDYLKYLDSSTSSEGKIAAEVFNSIHSSHITHVEHVQDLVQRAVRAYPVLKNENYKYVPLFLTALEEGVLHKWRHKFISFLELVLDSRKNFLYKVDDNFLKSLKDKDPLLTNMTFNSSTDLLTEFRVVSSYLDTYSLYSKLPEINFRSFLKRLIPIVVVNNLWSYNLLSKGSTNKLEEGSVSSIGYSIHYCDSSREVSNVTDGTKYTPWCIIFDESYFQSYSKGGRFVIFLKKGFESIPRTPPPSAKREDAYALSMIAAAFSPEGSLISVTSRRDDGEDFLTAEQLEEVVGLSLGDLSVKKEKEQTFVIKRDELVKANLQIPFVKIPKGITKIADSVFKNNESIFKLYTSDSLKVIGRAAFENCSFLEEVNLKEGLQIIFSEAFKDCTLLEEVLIPKSVKSIGPNSFEGCSSLTVANIWGLGIVRLNGVFKNCSNLKNVWIKSSQNLEGTFEGCSSLEKVGLPNNLESIGRFTFLDCSSLRRLHIPASVHHIDEYAFGVSKNSTPRLSLTISSKNSHFEVIDNYVLNLKDNSKIHF